MAPIDSLIKRGYSRGLYNDYFVYGILFIHLILKYYVLKQERLSFYNRIVEKLDNYLNSFEHYVLVTEKGDIIMKEEIPLEKELEERLEEKLEKLEKLEEKLSDEELSDAVRRLSRIYDEMGPDFSKSPSKSQLYTLLTDRTDLLTDEIYKFYLRQIELNKKLFGQKRDKY